MSILVKTIRVSGLRGLKNIEVDLDATTVLTGMNNSGKTSLLKAIQIALGNRLFITQDDFYISDNISSAEIIIDIKIIPVDEHGNISSEFKEDWEILFNEDKIKHDDEEKSFIPLRTIVSYDKIKANYKTKQYILPEWPVFENEKHEIWYQTINGVEKPFYYEEVPFFYVDAQRDILEDMKAKNSYLGRMISKIDYSEDDIKKIEQQIKELNEQAVSRSSILSNIKMTLHELDSAMDTTGRGVEITPFTKKIRDLNKGLSIHYNENGDSFSMEYHGMGTRSWSSLLTLKAYINLLDANAKKEGTPFFPILAIEEPESHLHPNAQKKLYSQIESIKGQKIISTHSPYVAACAELNQIRNIYKDDISVTCGAIKIDHYSDEDIRKINRLVIKSRGELFFSKAVVFIEGETEEQALPILSKFYFKKSSVEMGIDFVGVRGHGYLPFLRVAEALRIPWFIFSDAEESIKRSVKKQFFDSNSDKDESEVMVFLDDGNNFEKQLVSDGYCDEIRKSIIMVEISRCQSPQHEEAKRREIDSYDDTKLLDVITDAKVQYGSAIAEEIIKNKKPLPPKVIELFVKMGRLFNEGGE